MSTQQFIDIYCFFAFLQLYTKIRENKNETNCTHLDKHKQQFKHLSFYIINHKLLHLHND